MINVIHFFCRHGFVLYETQISSKDTIKISLNRSMTKIHRRAPLSFLWVPTQPHLAYHLHKYIYTWKYKYKFIHLHLITNTYKHRKIQILKLVSFLLVPTQPCLPSQSPSRNTYKYWQILIHIYTNTKINTDKYK